jgi:hypothetical protein
MHFTTTPQRHCICFQMPQLLIERRIKRFGAMRQQGRWRSILPALTGLPMSTKVSIRLSAIDPSRF